VGHAGAVAADKPRSGPAVSELAFAPGTATPRKRPVQERSQATVTAILDATVRVLAEVAAAPAGGGELTTTRVAEVAGVSVGTLYQYFPNRDALLVGVLADHLEIAIGAVEAACAEAAAAGLAREAATEKVVRAFLAAKAGRAHVSRLLERAFGTGGSLDDRPIVTAAAARAARAIAGLLGDANDPAVVMRARILCAALEGVVRAAIDDDPARLADPAWIEQVVALAIHGVRAGAP
jgi:AcrR family transcriptional regulator